VDESVPEKLPVGGEMKIKRMIKQLLCAHRWECHAVSYSEGMVSRYYQCPKCGRRTKMVYGPYRKGTM
jgi:hypothetical protein